VVPELVVLVLNDPEKIEDVLAAWLTVGVSGATILHSRGLSHQVSHRNLRDDLPLFPSLEGLLRSQEESHRTLFVVVPDGFDVEALVAATERITGTLDEPQTGILFTVPVTHAWGLQRRQR
jgi:nitrogen regulatory protein P-II 1